MPATDPSHAASVVQDRNRLLRRLFPSGVPTLWCPPLTHYDGEGVLDATRIRAHLRHLSRFLRGILAPGSTGDAWELSDPETVELLRIVLPEARRLGLHVLVGVLRPEPAAVGRLADRILGEFTIGDGGSDAASPLEAAGITGFTLCPPRGADASQEQIEGALSTFLGRGLPTALYQLPQVTRNEMSAPVVARLVARHPNLLLLKDTSGLDRVALSGLGLGELFLVRGAEGEYARWLKATGGPYDGFLLSSANCFARELQQILVLLATGAIVEANRLSGRVSQTVSGVFDLAAGLSAGNPFANANKAMDHFFAHGPDAHLLPAPRLHAGGSLPPDMIAATREVLHKHGFLPDHGYLG